MLTIINLLIILFILLIIYQIFLAHFSNRIIEGLDNYKEYDSKITYDTTNVMTLAQQNASNIEFLKNQIDTNPGLKQEVEDISGNVANLTQQVNDLVQSQQDYLDQKLPAEPIEITGTGAEDDNEEEPEKPTIETTGAS